jgi:hypothetical protein
MFPIHEKPIKLTRCMADSPILNYYNYTNKTISKLNISRAVSEYKKNIKNNILNIQRSKSNPI